MIILISDRFLLHKHYHYFFIFLKTNHYYFKANKYSFNSTTGILSNSSNKEALIGPDNQFYQNYNSEQFGSPIHNILIY